MTIYSVRNAVGRGILFSNHVELELYRVYSYSTSRLRSSQRRHHPAMENQALVFYFGFKMSLFHKKRTRARSHTHTHTPNRPSRSQLAVGLPLDQLSREE